MPVTRKTRATKAIKALGGPAAAARLFEITPLAIQAWKRNGIPAERCPTIERLTNGLLRCEQMRPDIEWQVLRRTAIKDHKDATK